MRPLLLLLVPLACAPSYAPPKPEPHRYLSKPAGPGLSGSPTTSARESERKKSAPEAKRRDARTKCYFRLVTLGYTPAEAIALCSDE